MCPSAQSHTFLSARFVKYQQQSVPVYSTTYKLLFKVMFCDWEQNSSRLINSTKSIPLSPGKCHREAIQHAKVEPRKRRVETE